MGPVTDLPMRWRFWIPVWVIAAIVVTVSLWLTLPVNAAPVDVEDCVAFAKAGDTKLYRCVDPEYGTICYLNPLAAGIIDCVEN